MMPSVQYSKGLLVFLIWQVWLPSFVSSQSSTVPATSEPSTMVMETSSVSMTSGSAATNAMASTTTSSSALASATTASSTTPVASLTTATTVGTSVTSVVTMSASTNMVSTSVASTMTTDNTSMSSVSISSPDYSTMESSNNSMISCRSFSCDESNCYTMFMNTNSSSCPSMSAYCELRKWNESMYSVRCADSCDLSSTGCANNSQINCVKDCCNMTDCLNTTLQSMGSTPDTTGTPTTIPAMTMTMQQTTKPVTMQNNGKKCKGLTCTGTDCYKNTQAEMTWCYDPQSYCELKKTTDGSAIKWMAGCANDCTQETACTSSTATCHQECCEASAAGDCLKLDGSMAMPNSGAYRFIFSPLLLLATSMMAWLIMGEQL